MRIAFFTDTAYPVKDGVSIITKELAEYFCKAGHEVILFSLGHRDEILDFGKLKIYKFKSKTINVYPAYQYSLIKPTRKIYKILQEFDPDIIHSHSNFVMGAVAYQMACRLNKPFVSTFHTFIIDFACQVLDGYSNEFTPPMKFISKFKPANSFVKLLIRGLGDLGLASYYNLPDRVTVPSKICKDYISFHCPDQKVDVIPNFYNSGGKRTRETVLRKKYNINKKDFVILHVGRISTEKRIDIVIKVAANLMAKYDNIKLIITSDGPVKKDMQTLAKELGISKKVIFTGYIDEKDLKGLYKLSNVFVSPALFETFNVSAMTAMDFAIPIVGAESNGLKSIIINGYNGFLVKHENNEIYNYSKKIELICKDRKLAGKLGANGIKLAKKMNIKAVAKQYIQTYKKTKPHKKGVFKTINYGIYSMLMFDTYLCAYIFDL